MEVSVGLLFILAEIVQGFHLQGPSGPLVAQLGGSVLLPCSAETPLPLEELEVQWRRTDSESLVHLFQEGEERPESQDYAYSGRAHFFTVEVSQGNYSIRLNSVSREDAGIYSCKAYIGNEAHKITVELQRIEYLVVTTGGAVSAPVGEEVVLNCSVDSNIPPEGLIEVTWKRADQEILVLLYRYDDLLSNSSHQRYKGRAEFFTSEIPKGNFSLRLKDVRPDDTGEYICEAQTRTLTGKSTVKLDRMGVSYLHYLVLICCAASFLISCVALVDFVRKERNDHVLAVHFLLVFSPNILLFSGFILLGLAEGLFSEAAACSVVNLTRIFLLLVATPYLGAVRGSFQKLIKVVGVTVQHIVIALVVYSDAYSKRLKWISLGLLTKSHMPKVRLYAYFGLIIFSGLCGIFTDINSAYQLPCMLPRSEQEPTSPWKPSKQVWTFMLLELSSIIQMLFLSLKSKAYTNVIRNGIIWIAPLVPIAVVLIRRLVRNKLQRKAGRLLWTATMAVLLPIYFVTTICILGHTQDAAEEIQPGEGPGLLCVFALLKMLTNLTLSKHPVSTTDKPRSILYMFGAAGLSIVNSIGLGTKLILILGYGNHNVLDLRLITLPSECVFVFGWFTLQIHDYWTYTYRTENNSEMHEVPILQDTADSHEMDAKAQRHCLDVDTSGA